MKQTERVLRHLQDYGSITPMDAIRDYGIMRLAARICDLREQGYSIKTKKVRDRNRYGEPSSYASYSL
jgi:hypothetical protein